MEVLVVKMESGIIKELNNGVGGTIKGSENGILLWQGKIENLNNGGNIEGSNGIHGYDMEIKKFNNAGNITSNASGQNGGVFFRISGEWASGKIDDFTNSGLISHNNLHSNSAGVYFSGIDLTNFLNDTNGVIKGSGNADGLLLSFTSSKGTSAELVSNKGQIISENNVGIRINNGANIKTLENSGTIQAGKDGILIYDIATFSQQGITLGSIDNSGKIYAGQDGIRIGDEREAENGSIN
ncbi:hypothetical protein [Helicobacter burdigaliensis]|uniref:hypothetical protein n=1 Tax=Helicobacter burdigaliensis TaxID=2315334 RepID=UPI000EF73BE0|nr:hypothetical protein [Helicobacter burdigaliensis]